jgi:Fe-S cluster assembly iron-binding protein IscA
MLTVSDTAAEELRKTLDEAKPDVAYRLVSSHDGYQMKLDSPAEDDRTIESEDRLVLMLTPDIDQRLTGVVLDVEGEEEEKRLTLRPTADTS